MSLEVTILAHPDSDDGSGRTIEVRSLAQPFGDVDPLEDSRLFAGGETDAVLACVRQLLERHADAIPLAGHRECRRCGNARDATGALRSPFVCDDCISGTTRREGGEDPGTTTPDSGDGVETVFLGAGDAFGSGGRRSASIFLRARGAKQGILLDAGPGCLASLHAEGLGSEEVGALVLSHFHGDHFGGVTFLELDRSRNRHARPLPALTPPGGSDRIRELRRALYPGFQPRSGVQVREMLPGETASLPVEAGGGQATPFGADHQPRAWAFGWRIRLGGRTIVYSGDTAWNPRILRESDGADLLIHECTGTTPLPGHTSHADLARAATAIKARRVLLVHAGSDVLALSDPVFPRAHDGLRVVV